MSRPFYPRQGRLAQGDGTAFHAALQATFDTCAGRRARGIRENMPQALADLLEDTFQCGVIIQDKRLGRSTKIQDDAARKTMHRVRARFVERHSRWFGSPRDEDKLVSWIENAGRRAFDDGMMLSATGAHSLEPLFRGEPTEKWRLLPDAYEFDFYYLCASAEACHAMNDRLALMPDAKDPKRRLLATASGTEPKGRRGIYPKSITLAGLKSLAKAGFITFDDAAGSITVTDLAREAYREEREYRRAHGTDDVFKEAD